MYLRGLSGDFENWGSWGNVEWTDPKVLSYFRKAETDFDIRDDFHGTEGPLPIVRREKEPWP